MIGNGNEDSWFAEERVAAIMNESARSRLARQARRTCYSFLGSVLGGLGNLLVRAGNNLKYAASLAGSAAAKC